MSTARGQSRHQAAVIAAISGALVAGCIGCVTLPAFDQPNTQATPYAGTTTGSATGTPGPSTTRTPTDGSTPTPSPSGSWLHNQGGHIKNAGNENVVLHGIGWYGFESDDKLNGPHPQYANRLGSDVGTILQRFHLMGFNVVNVGMAFSQLYNPDGSRIMTTDTMAVPCTGTSTQADIVNSVSIPGFAPNPNAQLLANVPAASPGMCNTYLPGLNQPVVARLAAIVDIFTRNGMYVLLEENVDRDPGVTLDPTAFASQWAAFANDLINYAGAYEGIANPSCSDDPNGTPLALCHNVILGLMSNAERLTNPGTLTWEPNSGYRTVGAHALLNAALTTLPVIMPRVMYQVSGAFQNGYTTSLNGGVDARVAGFPAAAGPAAVASAAGFFQDVLGAPAESQLIFGFNAYGPAENTALLPYTPMVYVKLAADLDNSFAMLATGGINDTQGVTHRFPSMPIAMGANPGDANDHVFLQSMQSYMSQHEMPHFIWWCWDGATGTNSGLVDPNYYATLNPYVVQYLQTLQLTPAAR